VPNDLKAIGVARSNDAERDVGFDKMRGIYFAAINPGRQRPAPIDSAT